MKRIACLVLIPAVVFSQGISDNASLVPELSVRMKAPRVYKALIGVPWLRGTVAGTRGDTLFVESDVQAPLQIPVGEITRFEVQQTTWVTGSLAPYHAVVVASQETLAKRGLVSIGNRPERSAWFAAKVLALMVVVAICWGLGSISYGQGPMTGFP